MWGKKNQKKDKCTYKGNKASGANKRVKVVLRSLMRWLLIDSTYLLFNVLITSNHVECTINIILWESDSVQKNIQSDFIIS
jgi:hypothetical protein